MKSRDKYRVKKMTRADGREIYRLQEWRRGGFFAILPPAWRDCYSICPFGIGSHPIDCDSIARAAELIDIWTESGYLEIKNVRYFENL